MNAKRIAALAFMVIMIFTSFTGCELQNLGSKNSGITGKIVPVDNFYEGLAIAKCNDLYGYIDVSGQMVIPPAYSTAEPFHDGLAKVSYEQEGVVVDLYIDTNGNEVLNMLDQADDYPEICGWGEGLFTARTESDRAVYLNINGEEVFGVDENFRLITDESANYDGIASDFHGGFAFIETEHGIGRIDKNGVVCETDIKGTMLQPITDGIALFSVKKKGEYRVSVYNVKENMCVVSSTGFSKDLVAKYYPKEKIIVYSSETDGKCGIMNLSAEIESEFDGCKIGAFACGVAPVTYTDEEGGDVMAYVNANGDIVKDKQSQYIFGDFNDDGYALWIDAGSEESENASTKAYVATSEMVTCSISITCDAFKTVPTFSDGFVLVPYQNTYAMIGTDGNLLVPFSALGTRYNPEVTPERIPTYSGSITDYVGTWVAFEVYVYSEDNDMCGELYKISYDKIGDNTDVIGVLNFKTDGSAEYIFSIDDVIDEHGQGALTVIDGEGAKITYSDEKAFKLISNAKDVNVLYCCSLKYPHDDSALFVLRRDNSVKMPELSNESESKILPLVKTHEYSKDEILRSIESLKNEGYSTKDALRIARNELYANFGYVFKDDDLNKYFYVDHADLYAKNPYYDTDDIYSLFNEYEVKNIKTIKKLEKEYD